MELRHLRYFIAVAEESTLSSAAKRLRIAQPALTRQIHDLELQVGVELFERSARGVELTAAGDVCLASARHILHQVEVAIQRARGSSQGVVGSCVICVDTMGLSSGRMARIVARVHDEYPAIDLSIMEGATERQWKALQLLEADIGLGLVAPKKYVELSSEALDYEIFDAVLLSTSHALARQPSLTLVELRGETFLTLKPGQLKDVARQERAEFARVGFKPASRREFDDVYSLAMMAAAGLGWALYPRKRSAPAGTDLTVVPLSDFALPIAQAVLWRSDDQRPVIRTVLAVIRRLLAEERIAADRGTEHAPEAATVSSVSEVASVEQSSSVKLELRHLRYFCAVVEAKSFGRAAEGLSLTQPALSRQVRDLERAVSVELLERAARGATVTPAGDSFFKSARRILDEAGTLPAEAQRAQRGMVARCVVVNVPTTRSQALLRDLMRRCALEMPRLEFILTECHTPAQPAVLRSAHADIGICHASPMSPVDERGLRRERLSNDLVSCALVPADSSLAARDAITFSDLADIPFLFAERAFQPRLYDQIFSLFRGRSFRPRIEHTYDGLKTSWAMVAEGRGWAIGFQSQCSDPPPGTVAVPIVGFAMPWGLDILYRDDESRTVILLAIDMLHELAGDHEQPSAARARSAAGR